MDLPLLQEMLELNEAGSIVDAFKGGYNRTKDSLEKAAKKVQDLSDKDLADDMNQWLSDFFTKFPGVPNNGPEDILKRYPTKASRDKAEAAYRALSARIETMRKGFNRSLLSARKINAIQGRKIDQHAKKMMGANPPAVPGELIRFVRGEARYFQRLVRIKDNTTLNDGDFKDLLELRMNRTLDERKYDAALALNMMFGYMEAQFNKFATQIDDASREADEAARKKRMGARANTPPAEEVPDESEADVEGEGGDTQTERGSSFAAVPGRTRPRPAGRQRPDRT